MIKVGLTGGMGSGKTMISSIFEILGIPVFQADLAARRLLEEDEEIRTSLISWYGEGVYQDGKPDRSMIASIIFRQPAQLAKVNGIIHPKVYEEYQAWLNKLAPVPFSIHEAAILFESGFNRYLDKTILVTAPEKIRIERIRLRDGLDETQIRQRMENQWSDDKKAPLADYLLNNEGCTAVIPQVIKIFEEITK